MTILDKIIASKRDEVTRRKTVVSEAELEAAAAEIPAPRDFFGALSACDSIGLIAEIKKASPSAGIIREDFDPVALAKQYAAGGATCISVLTDEEFFEGRLQYLTLVKSAVELPVLRKDFIIDRYQLLEARAAGADAVLLIAECLDDCMLRSLHNATIDLGMTPLVELHASENVPRVVECGAQLVGINNRDLHTFETDLQHTLTLKTQLTDDCLVVSESGIRSHDDLLQLQASGVQAVLVGEHLMRQPDVEQATRTLLAG